MNSKAPTEPEKDVVGENIQAFYQLLEKIDQVSSNSTDKGTRFETLSLSFFKSDSLYKGCFTNVQTYKDWAQEHPDLVLTTKDIGIDLVATNALTQEGEQQSYTAIQCKFYHKDAVIPKTGIDSFLAASSTSYFSHRIIIATNSNWSDNLMAAWNKQVPKVSVIDREMLAKSSIDWAKFDFSKDVQEVLHKRQLRPYQEQALNNVISGFKTYHP